MDQLHDAGRETVTLRTMVLMVQRGDMAMPRDHHGSVVGEDRTVRTLCSAFWAYWLYCVLFLSLKFEFLMVLGLFVAC